MSDLNLLNKGWIEPDKEIFDLMKRYFISAASNEPLIIELFNIYPEPELCFLSSADAVRNGRRSEVVEMYRRCIQDRENKI